ncbi:uncharacterized protein LOC142227195 [Haematobia irritans]|uniref:uncharacterized protein LOC142227195 n=1 Tax=Haematobia irritans TaxID=7368 RepID=UPI003F4F76E6
MECTENQTSSEMVEKLDIEPGKCEEVEDIPKMKEPINILSVEVMSSGVMEKSNEPTLGDSVACHNAVNADHVANEHNENEQSVEMTNDCGVSDNSTHIDKSFGMDPISNQEESTNINETSMEESIENNEAVSSVMSDANNTLENYKTQPEKETSCIENAPLIAQKDNLESSTTTLSTTGLSLLVQYGSDNESDTDSVIEVPLSSNNDYRNQVVDIDSDSDSESSSSSGDSDVEYLNVIRKKIDKCLESDDEDGDNDDDDNEGNKQNRKPKTKVKAKGELLIEDLPPIQDLQITVPEDECIELGKIHSIVDQLVLVSALPNSVLLDLETVLFLDKGQKVLGEVFDVLGQVADPLYCVRFNSNSQINEKNINVGDVVYVAPKTQYTQFIILSSLMNMKGSDASWKDDIEPPPRYLDYSDDEQEQLARRQQRNKNRPTDHEDPEKRPRRDSSDEAPQPSFSRQQTQPQQGANYRNRQSHSRGNEGSNQNYGRPRAPHHQNRPPYNRNQQNQNNNHPSSWHSNYYPQSYPVSPQGYGYGGGYPPMPMQGYPPQVPPMYAMGTYPPHNSMRPPFNSAQVPPPMLHGGGVFHMRPPTMGQFESSPPPPGSQ